MGNNVYYLDQKGLDDINATLKQLREEEKANIIAIEEARAQGDLSENADYDAAKKAQVRIKKDIYDKEQILKNAELIEVVDDGLVSLGKYVKVLYVNQNEEYNIKLLGVVQVDPEKNIISNDSPLGKALIGHKIGDSITFTSETGNEFAVKILDVRVNE